MQDNEMTAPDILDFDPTGVDTSAPILPKAIYDLEIKNVERGPNKDQTGENVKITLITTQPHIATNGQEVSPGFPLYKYIALTPRTGEPGKKDYTTDDIKREVTLFCEAVHGAKVPMLPLDKHIGRRVRCKIGISPATDQYEESNNVRFVK